jgi:hypothetical protein
MSSGQIGTGKRPRHTLAGAPSPVNCLGRMSS